MPKHGWNVLQNYLAVHDKTLRFYEKYMEEVRTYTYQEITDRYHLLLCQGIFFHTYNGTLVRVDIEKDIEVDPEPIGRPRARTSSYTYSANLPRIGPLIRYCSPHQDWEEEGSAPHHAFHHRHDYTKNPKGDVRILPDDSWPHVGEFLEEVLKSF